MRTMNRTAIVVLSAVALAACSPGMYTGGGWAHTAGAGDSNASFSFSVESCDTETLGHFSLNDEGWKVPVEMSGHVMDFGELGDRLAVFDRKPPHAVYVPNGSDWQATATTACTP